MAKVITDVLLKDGVDETTFINDVTSNDEVDLKDRVRTLFDTPSNDIVVEFSGRDFNEPRATKFRGRKINIL